MMSEFTSTQGRKALSSRPKRLARQEAGVVSDGADGPFSIEAMAEDARRRLKAAVGRSAGQHLRQMRASWGRVE